jgi:hypothetical protein
MRAMAAKPSDSTRADHVRSILAEMYEPAWEGFEYLASWDGEELDELRPYMDEESYQALLDELASREDDSPRG